MHLALKQYYRAYQKKYVTKAAYLKNFSNNEDVFMQTGGVICCRPSLITMFFLIRILLLIHPQHHLTKLKKKKES